MQELTTEVVDKHNMKQNIKKIKEIRRSQNKEAPRKKDTYNTRDSLVVTDPTTSLALTGLSMGERTGSRVFQWVWLYVSLLSYFSAYKDLKQGWIREVIRAWGGSKCFLLMFFEM